MANSRPVPQFRWTEHNLGGAGNICSQYTGGTTIEASGIWRSRSSHESFHAVFGGFEIPAATTILISRPIPGVSWHCSFNFHRGLEIGSVVDALDRQSHLRRKTVVYWDHMLRSNGILGAIGIRGRYPAARAVRDLFRQREGKGGMFESGGRDGGPAQAVLTQSLSAPEREREPWAQVQRVLDSAKPSHRVPAKLGPSGRQLSTAQSRAQSLTASYRFGQPRVSGLMPSSRSLPDNSRVQGTEPCTCAQLIETLGVGGAEQLAVRIANGMAEAGHASHLIVLSRTGPLARFVSDRVTLHELGITRESIKTPIRFLSSLRSGLGRLEAAIRDGHIDIVQTHLPGANFWGLLLTLRRTVPVLATIHNNQEFSYGDKDDPLRARMRRRAYAAIVRRGAGTIAVSAAVKDSLACDLLLDDRSTAKITVVANGVPITASENLPERDACRRMFGLPMDTVVFVAAGRHAEQKNFSDLVSAASILKRTVDNWHLVVAGDGPEREQLMRRMRDAGLEGRMSFPGNVMAMTELWVAADAFVMSSRWEGLPLVLLEAMAVGLPVVAPRIPGVVDVVTDGVEGILVPPQNPSALAQAMETLIREPERMRALGSAARETVTRRFDFASTIAALRDLYESRSALGLRQASRSPVAS